MSARAARPRRRDDGDRQGHDRTGRGAQSVLTKPPGHHRVHLRLVQARRRRGSGWTRRSEVEATEALFGDLKVLLEPRCRLIRGLGDAPVDGGAAAGSAHEDAGSSVCFSGAARGARLGWGPADHPGDLT